MHVLVSGPEASRYVIEKAVQYSQLLVDAARSITNNARLRLVTDLGLLNCEALASAPCSMANNHISQAAYLLNLSSLVDLSNTDQVRYVNMAWAELKLI